MHSDGITLHPKSELAGSPSAVDAVLKTLKTSGRQLQTSIAAFRDEMQILERLYYKGKNQHRTALFWRRVCEVRRYGDRINRADLLDLVEGFRRSFWGPAELHNPKLLKASWTHFPDELHVESLRKRLSTFQVLCNKGLERTTSAFEHISLCMQTGAFIQLLLTLYGIFARAHDLVAQIGNTIEVLVAACLELQLPYRLPPKNLVQKLTNTSEPSAKDEIPPKNPEVDVVIKSERSQLQSPLVGSDITFQPKAVVTNRGSVDRKRPKSSDEAKQKPKKRKKKDEIDEIFGF